jgi:glutamate dehydrogenase
MSDVATQSHDLPRVSVLDELARRWNEAADHREVAGVDDLPNLAFAGVSTNDLTERRASDLIAALTAHWTFVARRQVGETLVRVITPATDEHGWDAVGSIIQIATDDMPFLVDSVTMAARRRGLRVELIIHPVLHVQRDADGNLRALIAGDATTDEPSIAESHMNVEIQRISDDHEVERIVEEVRHALDSVRAAVHDWTKLRQRARELADDIDAQPIRSSSPIDRTEGAALLRWMADNHFTLLGAADFAYIDGRLLQEGGSGLGIMADHRGLAFAASDDWRASDVLLITKTAIDSVVHRPGPYDVIGTKRYGTDARIIGERRIIGFFTSDAYYASPSTIPVLRRKVETVLARSGLSTTGHAGKELKTVLESYPRDELFAASPDHLLTTALSVVQLQERRRVRVFTRRDVHRRVWTAIVFLPRDRYNTDVRRRVEAALRDALGGERSEFSISLTESSLARLYLVIHLADDVPFADPDLAQVERRVADAVRSWDDALRDALADRTGHDAGASLTARFAEAFPPEFMAVVAPHQAVNEVLRVANVLAAGDPEVHIDNDDSDADAQLKIYVPDRQIDLADLLPMLANLGVRVSDERATEVSAGDRSVWIHDLTATAAGTATTSLADPGTAQRLHHAIVALLGGEATDDGFNRLVVGALLEWREVQILRTYAAYLRQLGFSLSQGYVESTLVEHGPIAADLVGLFRTRFDPDLDRTEATAAEGTHRDRITSALDAVPSLDQDRILRALLGLIEATVRTNWFQVDDHENPPAVLGLKLETGRIADAPFPRPRYEIFLHGPTVEGVHLRMASVARGGLRWSERPEDFRTEVLGLMKAQAVKNAVIVPAGAKGGFIARRTFSERRLMQEEVVRCYRLFITTLLSLTDNLIDGTVVPPRRTVRHDGDDSYLVVAADKGTATFSDIANEIAVSRGFWLGDAFASGGSAGYDHKAMGITARGAWESVKQHLRRLGRGPTHPITVVGIGDMSGDVFGNGMLLSEHIELIGAFDHRHVMLDPSPDAARTFKERQRLFALPSSSWDDFDRSLISKGGGVWPRTAKAIPISAEACAALGIDRPLPVMMSPTELIHAMLQAPVDLLWNGGIGTYVKSSDETHAAAGDRTNDALRVNAHELRCRIVGEGGNLGLTQRARIEFAKRGGLINTDAIDNSAGVDTSDHEVNIKILLDRAVRNGALGAAERNDVLAAMTNDVAALVLADNIDQNQALVNAVTLAPAMLETHGRYLTYLEQTARLDRNLEALPDTDALLERKAQGAGLTAPELAVMLAYTKLSLSEQFLAEGFDEEAMKNVLHTYFPILLREKFTPAINAHPLRREIIATAVVNKVVNRNGVTFVFRLQEETHASVGDVLRAHSAACALVEADELWGRIRSQPDADEGTIVSMLLEVDRVVERMSRWLLQHCRLPLDANETVTAYQGGVAHVAAQLDTLLSEAEQTSVVGRATKWTDRGSAPALAARVALLDLLPASLDITALATSRSVATADVARAYFILDERLGLGTLRERIVALPRNDRWDALARSALRDDLAGEHRALTAAVLATGESVDAWSARNESAIAQHLATLRDMEDTGHATVASLSVVLRGLRSLAATL